MEKTTWQGNVISKVRRGTRNQVWSLVGDFLGLHKLHPMISTCRLVEGVPGQPGCVRYCSNVPPTEDIVGEAPSNLWVNERLLSLDPIGQSLSYEITENNMGFTRYIATLKVVGGAGANDDSNEDGCSLEWCFDADPMDGFSEEGLVSILQNGLDGMAAKVEDALHA